MIKRLRLAVVWANLGPYHYARLRGLQGVFDVTAIQLYGRELERGWGDAKPAEGLAVDTVSSGGVRLNAWSMAWRVWQALSAARPQAVLSPGYSDPSALTAALWARKHRTPVIVMSESTSEDRPRVAWKELAKRLMVSALYPAAIVGGVRAAKYVASLGIPADRIGRFHNVVGNDFFWRGSDSARDATAPASHSLPEQYFLYVGRLSPEKNLERLIEAFRVYRSDGGGWQLVVVGSGPSREGLEASAAGAGLSDAVRFLGSRTVAELLPCYAFASCFVLPSLSEPWGLVVNEAMAAGLPVLVSDRCGCVDDLVEEGGNGMTFDPADVSALARAMATVSSLSSAKLQRMGARSREIIAEYSPENFASEVQRLIQRIR